MEKRFIVQEITHWENSIYGINETELRRRFIQAVKYFSDGMNGDLVYTDENFTLSDWWWKTHVLPVLLHGEAEEKDEWDEWAKDFPNPLGDRVGPIDDLYIDWDKWKDSVTHWFRKMPRGK